jgi:uncharacterized protein YoxC
MSEEHNYSSTEVNTSGQPPKRNNTVIFIIIIAVLLGINIYLFTSRNKVSQQRDEAYTQLDTVTVDRDNVKSEYDAALARLDLLVGKNAQLDSMVTNKESEINRLRSQIQGILSNSRATAADYSRARALVGQLNSKVKTYEERIAELEQDNTRLNKYNQTLSEERDSTVTKNIALSQKVRLGSVLHASNIRMVPIDLKRNGKKEKETSKASRVDIFRITFDIDENRIAEDGVKDLYIRIIGPGGSLLSNAAYGSGVTNTSDGQTLNYTMAKQVSLQQGVPVKDIVVDWHQDSDYERGTYKIEIYNEGYKVGSGSIDLH